MARHVRERLLQVIPGHQPGVICNFYLMAEGSSANAGERDNLCRANRRSCRTQSGCRSEQGALPIPRRGVDHSRKANRVKCSTGSRNARWRREPPGGDTEEPGSDPLRGSAEKADREKLNDERGIKPLPVNRSRDGAESGQNRSGRIGEQLLYSSPRNHRAKGGGNYARAGAQDIPDRFGRERPTDVTAVAKSRTNRARSVAAGVVSGAGQVSRCFKGRTLMRVSPVGPGAAWTR